MPAIQKFNYLLGCLGEWAQKAIRGINITSGNYEEPLGIIKRRFENQDTIKRNLYFELRRIPPCTTQVEELRGTVEALERICRQMKTMGKNLQQTMLILTIDEKLPPSVLVELGKDKLANGIWQVEELFARLCSSISLRKEAYAIRHSHLRQNSGMDSHAAKTTLRFGSKNAGSLDANYVGSSEAVSTWSGWKHQTEYWTWQSYRSRKKLSNSCAFCGDQHFHND